MPSATLITAGTVSIVVGLSFALVARAVGRRQVSTADGLAQFAHAAWWASLSVYLVMQGMLTVSAAYGHLSSGLYFASRVVLVPLLCAGVWGISSYLLFLYSGARRVFVWTGLFYVGVMLLFGWATYTASRTLVVTSWLVSVDDGSTLYRIVYLLVGLPPVLAALAYLGLVRVATTRAQRYRIVLVSLSILMYVGSGLMARLSANDVAIFVTLVLFGALAALAGILAYYPPPRLRAWVMVTPEERAAAEERRLQLRRMRLLELVIVAGARSFHRAHAGRRIAWRTRLV